MPLSKDLIYKISFFTDKTSGGAIWLSKDLICKKWRLLTCDREQCGQCRYYDITTVRYSDRPLFRHSIIPYKTIYDPHDPWPMVGPYIAYMTKIHHGWPTNDPFNWYFWPTYNPYDQCMTDDWSVYDPNDPYVYTMVDPYMTHMTHIYHDWPT